MGKHHNDPQKRVFFFKPETLLKIVRLIKFPAFMLTISCSALLLTVALKQLPSMFTITIPGHECTFTHLSLDDQQHVRDLLIQKTQHLSFFNGVEQLGKELLKEVPALTDVICSLDRNKKLHVRATGKTNPPIATTSEHIVAAHTPAAPAQPQQAPMSMIINATANKSFNELLSTQEHKARLVSHTQPVQTRYKSSLLAQQPPSFNPEILVSDTGN